MNPTIITSLIGVGGAIIGAIIGAILNHVLPDSKFVQWFKSKSGRHSLVADWKSSWGPLPEGPLKYQETVKIYRQRGFDIWGTATRNDEPKKKWELRGRFSDQFLQMYYFPSKDSKDIDFLDYGCYFLKKTADGSFKGYSTGFGKTSSDNITTDYHELRRM